MKLFLESTEMGVKRIKKKDARICVIGVGTVGLAEAVFFAESGFKVTGFDINQERVRQINNHSAVFEYPDKLAKTVKNKNLSATANPRDAIKNADAIIVCVPTPLKGDFSIDLKYVMRAASDMAENMERGALVIMESSITPGSTKEVGSFIEKKSGMKLNSDFGLAYCPERYNPGLPAEVHAEVFYDETHQGRGKHIFSDVSRVVGGSNKKSLELTYQLYSQIIKAGVHKVSSMEVAEASKLTENIFRDVNIALVNELAKIYSKLGLDTFEIIEASKTKPFAFLAHYPGAGVGGECIPVDTWYLIRQAEGKGCNANLMKAARSVNDSMPYYMVEMLKDAFKEKGIKIKGAVVTVLGLSYKGNILDTRESPTFPLVKRLKELEVEVRVCDPIVEPVDSTLTPLDKAFEGCDAIMLVTDHNVFKKIEFEKIKAKMRNLVVIDGRNFYNQEKLKSIGFSYRGVGKVSG